MSPGKFANPLRGQSGSVLLSIMLVLVVSASFVLVSKLNANTRQFTRQSGSLGALNEAKIALIAYAINYPETTGNPNGAPGTLPCPDINNDGSAGANCSFPATSAGRFPWRTLEMPELTDYSGEVLWYVVADNFRTPQVGPINSDTAGNLIVDGNTDVVAVIFSPGYVLAGQDRVAGPNNIANYLEDDNADADINFVSRALGEFNDTVVTITRQELMQAVEKRVLGDVSQAFAGYQTNFSAYPWLSPFSDPSTSTFKSSVGTDEGHVPYHYAADAAGASNRNPFSTNISANWNNIVGATTASSNLLDALLGIGMITLSDACLNDINDCDEGGIYPEITSLNSTAALNCIWTDKDTADCDSFSVTVVVPYVHNPVECPVGGTLTRTYTINYPAFTGVSTTVDPDAGNIRTRNVQLTAVNPAFIPVQAGAIEIRDRFTGQVFVPVWPGCGFANNLLIGIGTSDFDADTSGDIAINGINYDIDIDDGEISEWFVSNGWQDLIYVSYASGEPLPGNTTVGQDCVTLAANCLSVDADALVTANVRAVAVSAGVDLTPGTARPNGTLADYFEFENFVVDDLFMKDKLQADRNDQTRIIATAP